MLKSTVVNLSFSITNGVSPTLTYQAFFFSFAHSHGFIALGKAYILESVWRLKREYARYLVDHCASVRLSIQMDL